LKKRIALVANSTWNIYNFRQNLIQKFSREGYDVVVIAPVDEYIIYKEKYPDVRHYNLRMLDRDSTNPIRDLLLILELWRKYRKLKPDIIIHFTHKPNIFGGLAAWLAGITSYATVTGLGYPFIHKGLVRILLTSLYKMTAGCHKLFIFENTEDKNLFTQKKIVPERKSRTVKGCGVDTQWFLPIQADSERHKTVFTFIGRLLYDKGIREFVEAARRIRSQRQDAEFWIVGELDPQNPATVDKEDLITWVQEGIVLYHGFVKDVRTIIASSDCIVLPSYREGLPRTIIEAMSMEKPVITTDTAGCNETVEEGVNGFLVPVQNTELLTHAMLRFLQLSPSERKQMGKKGRELAVTEFDDKKIAAEIFDTIKII
jgi:glycosyltransferase involved in cell wall biosynthesis